MKIDLLPSEERDTLGATHRIRIVAADLTEATANTAQVVKLMDLPVGSLVRNVSLVTHQKFADASDEAFNTTAVTIGDGATANLFVTSTELNTNGAAVRFKAGTGTQKAYVAAGALNATFAAMALKSLKDIDVGELWLFVDVINLATYDGGNI